jgi:hypothetical protein
LDPGKSLAFPDVPFSDKKNKVISANTASMNVNKDAKKRRDEIGWLLSVEEPANWFLLSRQYMQKINIIKVKRIWTTKTQSEMLHC